MVLFKKIVIAFRSIDLYFNRVQEIVYIFTWSLTFKSINMLYSKQPTTKGRPRKMLSKFSATIWRKESCHFSQSKGCFEQPMREKLCILPVWWISVLSFQPSVCVCNCHTWVKWWETNLRRKKTTGGAFHVCLVDESSCFWLVGPSACSLAKVATSFSPCNSGKFTTTGFVS